MFLKSSSTIRHALTDLISLQHKRLVIPAALAICGSPLLSFAGTYEQRFDQYGVGAISFDDGSILFANQGLGTVVGIQDDARRELQLTAYGQTSTASAFVLPDLDPGKAITAFSAKWNSQIYGASGTNAKADGFALTFGNLPVDLVSGFDAEKGPGTGLTLSVQTYDAGDPANIPGYRIFSDGVQLAYVNKSGDAWGLGSLYRNSFELDWSTERGMSLSVNGTAIFSNVPTPDFTPTPGMQLFFTARTGGVTQEFRLDNIAVVTGGTLTQIGTTGSFASGENAPNETADKAWDNDPTTKWLTFSSSGFIGAQTADGQPKTVTAYSLVTGNDASTRHPRSWELQGSNDGLNWDTVDSVTDFPAPVSTNNLQSFVVDNPGAYSQYRVNILGNNGSTLIQLDDVKLYELTTQVPEPGSAALLGIGVIMLGARRRRGM